MVSDSSEIKRLSCGKEDYENILGFKQNIDYTYIKYRLSNNNLSPVTKALMFYYEPTIFSIFGTRKIGVSLGIPFFKKYKSIIIDNFKSKLYLIY